MRESTSFNPEVPKPKTTKKRVGKKLIALAAGILTVGGALQQAQAAENKTHSPETKTEQVDVNKPGSLKELMETWQKRRAEPTKKPIFMPNRPKRLPVENPKPAPEKPKPQTQPEKK